jgi:hypothetical protein
MRPTNNILKGSAVMDKVFKEKKVEYDMPEKPNLISKFLILTLSDRKDASYSPVNESKK